MTDIGIELHLMTRGSSRDYRFIGADPVDRWWTKYSNWSRFEAPTIIVESGKFYLSGVSSAGRRDRVGTPIRYVLAGNVLSVAGNLCADGARIAINLLAKAVEELEGKSCFAGLAELFDTIDDELIEKALADDEEAKYKVLTKIGELLKALPDAAPRDVFSERQWCSGPTEDGLRALVATAERLLKGEEPDGLAAYLNLADEKDAQSVLGRSRFGGIVVKDGPRRPKTLARPPLSPAVGLVLILMGAVALTAWWLAPPL